MFTYSFVPTFIPSRKKNYSPYMTTNIIRHQKFAHTCLWPRLQCSFPAAWNLCTASDDWMCRNLATKLWVGPLCSMIQPSPLSGWPQQSMDELMMQVDSVPWQLTSHPRWGPFAWIVEPFKHFLRVTAHPQILALELQVPMGACPGQYNKWIYSRLKTTMILQQMVRHIFTYSLHTILASSIRRKEVR